MPCYPCVKCGDCEFGREVEAEQGICILCGHPNPSDAVLCEVCGAVLPPKYSVAKPQHLNTNEVSLD